MGGDMPFIEVVMLALKSDLAKLQRKVTNRPCKGKMLQFNGVS